MHNIKTFKFPNVCSLVISHEPSFQKRYRRGHSYWWEKLGIFLIIGDDSHRRKSSCVRLTLSISIVIPNEQVSSFIGCYITLEPFDEPTKSFRSSFKLLYLAYDEQTQFFCDEYLIAGTKTEAEDNPFSGFSFRYAEDDPLCIILTRNHPKILVDLIYLRKFSFHPNIYLSNSWYFPSGRLIYPVFSTTEKIFAERLFVPDPPLSESRNFRTDSPGCLTSRKIGPRAKDSCPNLACRNKDACLCIYGEHENFEPSSNKIDWQDSNVRLQSIYLSNAKKKEAQITLKIFDQIEYFKSLNTRSTPPKKSNVIGWLHDSMTPCLRPFRKLDKGKRFNSFISSNRSPGKEKIFAPRSTMSAVNLRSNIKTITQIN